MNQLKKETQVKEPLSLNGGLLNQFLKETGINESDLVFRTTQGKDIPPRDVPVFYEKNGDVHIPYFTIEGYPVQIPKGNKLADFERTRLKDPKPGQGKYSQPAKSGTFPYFPPGIIHKYRDAEPVKNLFIVEGEKKGLAGWRKLGLDFVAIGGIHSAKDNELENELHQDFQKLIEKCQVQNLILVFDADALTCNYDPDQPDKDLYPRAFSFFKSLSKFKELCSPLNIDLYFCHILPELKSQAKGLDELLLLPDSNPQEIKKELAALAVGQKKFTGWFNVSGNSDSKLKAYFGLDNAENFYSVYKSELGTNKFRLKRRDFQFNGEALELISPETNFADFWFPEKDKKGNTIGCKIDSYKLIQLIKARGFRRFDVGQDFTFIKIDENLIDEANPTQIQDDFLEFVNALSDGMLKGDVTKFDLFSKFYGSPQLYFSKNKLSLLGTETLEVNKDTLDTAFIYFRNGFLEITAEKISLKNYSELPFFIYKSQVQDRDFKTGLEECNFKNFVWNIAGKDEKRFQSLRTIIGYILHDFYDYKRRAVNLTDSRISDDDEGRTGKTLLVRATGHLKKYTEIPGKVFDVSNKHRYQDASFDTQIIHLNDVRRNFRLEYVFNDITDGIHVDKKNQQPFVINAKVVISSNKTLRVEGASAKDRIIEFELADHYSDKFTPEDEFGEWFFRDWDEASWEAFYNFMVNSIQLFLKEGIIKADSINLIERKLREETNPDFVSFMDDGLNHGFLFNELTDQKKYLDKEPIDKKDLHRLFLSDYDEYQNHKFLSQQYFFTKYLKKYAEYRGFDWQEEKSGSIRTIKFAKGERDLDNPEKIISENEKVGLPF